MHIREGGGNWGVQLLWVMQGAWGGKGMGQEHIREGEGTGEGGGGGYAEFDLVTFLFLKDSCL